VLQEDSVTLSQLTGVLEPVGQPWSNARPAGLSGTRPYSAPGSGSSSEALSFFLSLPLLSSGGSGTETSGAGRPPGAATGAAEEGALFTYEALPRGAMKELDVKSFIIPMRGGTDGAALSWRGLLTPNLFTGGHNYHGRFEFIPVQAMEKATAMVLKILELYVRKSA